MLSAMKLLKKIMSVKALLALFYYVTLLLYLFFNYIFKIIKYFVLFSMVVFYCFQYVNNWVQHKLNFS